MIFEPGSCRYGVIIDTRDDDGSFCSVANNDGLPKVFDSIEEIIDFHKNMDDIDSLRFDWLIIDFDEGIIIEIIYALKEEK